jgi:DNA topoisomerase-6 subunit B
VSITSPFIKFKNASKETIDASDDLVEEIRRALMQAGLKLGRHLRREHKAADLERKLAYIEKFAPILVEGLARIVGASQARQDAAEKGLNKILGRDAAEAEEQLQLAEDRLATQKAKQRAKFGRPNREDSEDSESRPHSEDEDIDLDSDEMVPKKGSKKTIKKTTSKKVTKKAIKKATSKKITSKKVTKKSANTKTTKKAAQTPRNKK